MKRIRSILGIIIPSFVLLLCLFGVVFAVNDPNETDIMNRFLSPSTQFPFGTDDLGRCVFSRVMYGGLVTIGIVTIGGLIVMVLGTAIGISLAGYNRKRNIFSESLLNAVTAIPPIAYLIIFIGIWGNSIPTMLVALTASLILRMIKLVKTLSETEYQKAYVLCAIASGASRLKIKFVHIMPNIICDVVQFVCLSAAEMILAISGFSFIGLSLGDDVVDWGIMISEARAVMGMRPALIFYPILFIFISALSFNYLGKQIKKEGN